MSTQPQSLNKEKEVAPVKKAKDPIATYSKEAILGHFGEADRLIAGVLLHDETRYSISDADKIVKEWKESKAK